MTIERLFSWSVESIRRGGSPAIAVFCIHVIASRMFHAYERFPSLDIPMHYFGGAAIAFFFDRASIAASERGIIGPFHRTTHTVLVFALTCTTTVFWEFAEYLVDYFFHTNAQPGLDDTLADMLLGICGGITLLVVRFYFPARDESRSTGV